MVLGHEDSQNKPILVSRQPIVSRLGVCHSFQIVQVKSLPENSGLLQADDSLDDLGDGIENGGGDGGDDDDDILREISRSQPPPSKCRR